MKILVCSDTHGRLLDAYDAIERELPDAVIHLGDHAEDAQELMRSYPEIDFYTVRGNNDFDWEVPLSRVITLAGVRLYLTHGHHERVHGSALGNLVSCAENAACQIACYGHTHRTRLETCGAVLVLNPGSLSLPRGGVKSYAVLEMEQGEILHAGFRNAEGELYHPATDT